MATTDARHSQPADNRLTDDFFDSSQTIGSVHSNDIVGNFSQHASATGGHRSSTFFAISEGPQTISVTPNQPGQPPSTLLTSSQKHSSGQQSHSSSRQTSICRSASNGVAIINGRFECNGEPQQKTTNQQQQTPDTTKCREEEVPIRIGNYELSRTIGKGTFAVVKLAQHNLTHSKVCITFFHVFAANSDIDLVRHIKTVFFVSNQNIFLKSGFDLNACLSSSSSFCRQLCICKHIPGRYFFLLLTEASMS